MAARTSATPGRSSRRTRRLDRRPVGRRPAGRPCSGPPGRRRRAAPRTAPRAGCRDRAPGSAARCASSAAGALANRPSRTAAASTTATTPSTVTRVRISGQLNALTSGLGRASPEVSITMCSGGGTRASRRCMVGTKSSATVQQMQPLASSTMSSSAQVASPQPSSSSRSTPISPNSLMISAMRRPSAWRKQVLDQAGLAGAEEAR